MSAGNHGSTPAAWTLVVLITLGVIVSTVGLVMGSWLAFWVGVGIVALGGIVGGVNAVLAYRAEASLGEQIDLLRGEGLLEDVYRD